MDKKELEIKYSQLCSDVGDIDVVIRNYQKIIEQLGKKKELILDEIEIVRDQFQEEPKLKAVEPIQEAEVIQ